MVEIPPAIVRDFTDEDRDTEVINTGYDSVTFTPGWGDSGYRVQTVEHECPACSFDRMTRKVDVGPTIQDEVRYWCLNPNCAHYLREMLSHAFHGSYPQRTVSEPTEFEAPEVPQ